MTASESCWDTLENITEHKSFLRGVLTPLYFIGGIIYPHLYDFVRHPHGFVPTKYGRAAPNIVQGKWRNSQCMLHFEEEGIYQVPFGGKWYYLDPYSLCLIFTALGIMQSQARKHYWAQVIFGRVFSPSFCCLGGNLPHILWLCTSPSGVCPYKIWKGCTQ